MSTLSVTESTTEPTGRRDYRAVGRFTWHFVEMVIAMSAGMALGLLWGLLLDPFGIELREHPAPHAIVMATDMAIGMGLWMRIRGHDLRMIGEMSAAMYVPFVVLLVPYELGYLSGDGLMVVAHVIMLPAMLVAMLLRREEYSGGHHRLRAPRTVSRAGSTG
jgi:hypothetical protein